MSFSTILSWLDRFFFRMVFPLASLAVILLYLYSHFFIRTYPGFSPNSSTAEITSIFTPQADGLKVGDILVQLGEIAWKDYITNPRQPLFPADLRPGEAITIRVLRNGAPLAVQWTIPGPTWTQVRLRLFDVWVLALGFWCFGAATSLLVRPRDIRWRLLVSYSFLTSIWIMAGCLSASRLWESGIILRSLIWVILPVFWHLHWVFPQPLPYRVGGAFSVLYLIGSGLAIAEWFQLLPNQAYFLGFILCLAGGMALLTLHALTQPAHRRELRLLGFVLATISGLAIVLKIAEVATHLPYAFWIMLIALPAMPGAYFYTIYRRQLGGLELRAHRGIFYYLYGGILVAEVVLLVASVDTILAGNSNPFLLGVISALLIGLTAPLIYPIFQDWFEQNILNMPLPSAHLVETYITQITTSLDIEHLANLIGGEIFPSLLIRQAVLLRLDPLLHPAPIVELGLGHICTLPDRGDIPGLLGEAGRPRPFLSGSAQNLICPWARLALALKVEGQPVGLCLLGRRDPDDYYPANTVSLLQTLMDQTALALMNIDQANQLHALYQADITREEAERSSLALELHDDVLGSLAMLAINMDERNASPQFVENYHSTVQHIRAIISGLRPGMLNYGLHSAFEELVDETTTQAENLAVGKSTRATEIEMNIFPSQVRYPPEVELHIYRIVQQSCQNALMHAQAHKICISGRLEPDAIDIRVTDDGIGLPTNKSLDISSLLAKKHFGLAGMLERATLIGARIHITSPPEKGTHIDILWQPK